MCLELISCVFGINFVCFLSHTSLRQCSRPCANNMAARQQRSRRVVLRERNERGFALFLQNLKSVLNTHKINSKNTHKNNYKHTKYKSSKNIINRYGKINLMVKQNVLEMQNINSINV